MSVAQRALAVTCALAACRPVYTVQAPASAPACAEAPAAAAAPAPTPPPAGDDVAAYLAANYTKREVRIPMRDGVHLYTAIYTPKDTSKTYPILLKRTPYSCSPYGADKFPGRIGPSPIFLRAGYIFVDQDVRGAFMSEGEFVNMTPHLAQKSGKSDSIRAPTPTTRSPGSSPTRRATTARSGCTASRTRAFTPLRA